MNVADYTRILNEQVDIFCHNEGETHTLIGGGYLQTLGHIIDVLSDSLRKSYLELPIVGGYYLYKYDVDYYYLVKIVYGTETKKIIHTNYRIKRPIKHTNPFDYESLLIDNEMVVDIYTTESDVKLTNPVNYTFKEQTNLFGGK